MRRRIELQVCPCCRYDHGSYFPRHCPDLKGDCGWLTCSHCGAVVVADGLRHSNHREHVCTPAQKESDA